jgi:MFS transporter, DHA2 family, multidrug resistance protein
MMSGMFLLPLFMQELLGFSATQSGLALMPRTIAMVVAMPFVARLYPKVGTVPLALAGLCITAYGQWTLSSLTLESSSANIMGSLVLFGVGMSMMMVPLQTVALSTIPRERLSDATGLSSLLRQIGGSMGVAAFATILTRGGVLANASVRAHLVAERPEVQLRMAGTEASMMARGLDAATAHGVALRSLAGTVARQGMVLAFDHLFMIGALFFALLIPLFAMLRRPPAATAAPAAAPVHVEME